MIILAADTSTPINTVCVSRDGCILAETVVHAGRRHSERLLETVDWALQEADVSLDDVEALAISVGPGSFTGLRVGVATWKGLAFGRRLPLVGVPTLDALAGLVPLQEGLMCTLLDARMHEVFGAVYRFDNGIRTKLAPDRVCPVEAILEKIQGPALFLGDGAVLYEPVIRGDVPGAVFAPPHCSVPRASAVAVEAFRLMEAGAPTDAGGVNPVYLRKSQPEEALKEGASS